MIRCRICGVSKDERSILTIGYFHGKIRIDLENESNPVYHICTSGECISKAKTGDSIGKAFGTTLNARDYLRIAQYANSSPVQTLESLIGLARKSGALAIGTESVVQKVRRRTVHLILFDPHTSKHTLDKLERLTKRFNCPLLEWSGSKPIEQVLNKVNCKVVGISDSNMADTVREML